MDSGEAIRRQRTEAGIVRALMSNHLASLFAHLGVNCVLDVGAHHGQFGALLRGMGYEGRIVSFEPLSEAFASLSQISDDDSQWTARHLALGERSGSVEIQVMKGSDFSSLKTPSAYGRAQFPVALAVEGSEPAEMRRLDEIFDEFVGSREGSVVFLKSDTQGYEAEVLRGAEGCLAKIAALQVEAAVKPIYDEAALFEELVADLENAGFELTGLFPVSRDDELRIIELDCVFSRAAGAHPGH